MFPIDPQQLIAVALIVLRIGGIIFAMPFFGDNTIPISVRIMMSIALSFGLYPSIPEQWLGTFSFDVLPMTILVLKEMFIGLTIGYVAKLMFEGIILGANIVGYQMGFGTADVFVADAGAPLSGFTVFHRLIILLIFLTLNLHHNLILAFVETFQLIPAGMSQPGVGIPALLIKLTGSIFYVAAQISAPVTVAILFTTVALGLIARTVPQMNVFVMSFPLSFFIGLAIYIASTPYMYQWLKAFYEMELKYVFEILTMLVATK